VNAATVVPLYQSIDREQFVLEEETALNVETGVVRCFLEFSNV